MNAAPLAGPQRKSTVATSPVSPSLTALISVSDKTGIVDFAKALADRHERLPLQAAGAGSAANEDRRALAA